MHLKNGWNIIVKFVSLLPVLVWVLLRQDNTTDLCPQQVEDVCVQTRRTVPYGIVTLILEAQRMFSCLIVTGGGRLQLVWCGEDGNVGVLLVSGRAGAVGRSGPGPDKQRNGRHEVMHCIVCNQLCYPASVPPVRASENTACEPVRRFCFYSPPPTPCSMPSVRSNPD